MSRFVVFICFNARSLVDSSDVKWERDEVPYEWVWIGVQLFSLNLNPTQKSSTKEKIDDVRCQRQTQKSSSWRVHLQFKLIYMVPSVNVITYAVLHSIIILDFLENEYIILNQLTTIADNQKTGSIDSFTYGGWKYNHSENSALSMNPAHTALFHFLLRVGWSFFFLYYMTKTWPIYSI